MPEDQDSTRLFRLVGFDTHSHYSLTTHYSLLTAHYSLLTTHCSLLTTHHCPLLTTHYSLLTTHYSPTHYSLLTAHCSLPSACLTAHHLPLIRFDRSRQGAPTFVCSHHGKRACVDMRMLEVAAAVVRQRSTITLEAVGASTLDEECLRFGEFTGLLEDQSRRFRVVGDGCGDCEPEEDNTIQPPGPIEYDIKIRAATLKALQHPTADNLNSTAVVAQESTT